MRQFNLKTQSWEGVEEAQPSALKLLQRTYRDEAQPLSVRLRAAIEALPFESPKLQAIGYGSLDGTAFADRLERALQRSNGARLIEGKVVEARTEDESS